VYWIRRQESDLRGLRSERSWDASNPHLNSLAGRLRIERSQQGFGDLAPPSGRPQIGGERTTRRPCPFGHSAVSSRSPWLVHSPELAEGGSHDDHTVAGTGCFRGSGGTLATSPSIIGGCGRSRTCTAVTPSRGSSPISTPMRAPEVGGEQ